MTDDDVAAGIYRLAKAHRRAAHDMRRRANLNVKANAKNPSAAIRNVARNAAEEIRLRASEEDLKAAFLSRAAALAKLGALHYRFETTPLGLAAARPSIKERIGAVVASVAAGLIAPKP